MSFYSKKINFKYILFFLTFFIFILSITCSLPKRKLSFREMTDRLFLEDITTETLSLHYTLAHPSDYSIHSYPITLPRYDKSSLKQSYCKIENTLFTLNNMDTSSLSLEESYCHTLLKDYFIKQKQGFSFTLLEENFSPSSGIVVNYPLLMAEYSFRTKKDVTDYLTLLNDTPNYFNSFFLFQKERTKQNNFLATVSLKEVVRQCDTIITQNALNENSHFLQITFQERLTPLIEKNIITQKEADFFLKKNDQILSQILLPAYKSLKNNLLSLTTEEIPLSGLYRKEMGRDYYQWLVQKQIGCNFSVSEILNILEDDFKSNLKEFQNLQKQLADFSDYELYLQIPFPLSDRNEMLKKLQQLSKDKFPSLNGFSQKTIYTTIKSVSDCMEEYTSPAFYMIPPIDDIWKNTIYINDRSTPEGLDLFTTLAHEGYPGHLYQTVYYQLYSNKENTPFIRHIMNYGGYVEGWAIYSEFCSYEYASKLYPEELQEFYSLWHKLLVCDKKLQLAILSILDINLHFYDDSIELAQKILNRYGIVDIDTIKEIYKYVLEEPGNYLKYYMGYLLLMDIKEKAEILMDSAFSDLKFHEFILSCGPSDFHNLEKRLREVYSDSPKTITYSASSNIDSK